MRKKAFDFVDDKEQVVVIYDKMFPLYIVKGDDGKNFLIDSGVTAKGSQFIKNIDKVLADTGSKGTGIDTLLLTHTHWDHTGSSYHLQQHYGFDVIVSQRGCELLQKQKVIDFINRLNQDYKKMVNDSSDTRFDKLQHLHPVKEGDRIPIGTGSYFEVIDVPGHTKCSVAYMLHPQRILFPGDSVGVLEQNNAVKPLFLSSYTQFDHSLARLIPLEANSLAFSHNRFIKGREKVKAHLQHALDRTRHVRDEIIKMLKTGGDIQVIAEKIYWQEFPKPTLLGPKEALVINLEAMVKTVKLECL